MQNHITYLNGSAFFSKCLAHLSPASQTTNIPQQSFNESRLPPFRRSRNIYPRLGHPSYPRQHAGSSLPLEPHSTPSSRTTYIVYQDIPNHVPTTPHFVKIRHFLLRHSGELNLTHCLPMVPTNVHTHPPVIRVSQNPPPKTYNQVPLTICGERCSSLTFHLTLTTVPFTFVSHRYSDSHQLLPEQSRT